MLERAPADEIGTTAKLLLAPYRFRRGWRCGPAVLSPRLSAERRRALARWLEAIPQELAGSLPRIKIAAAARLQTPTGHPAHAASFIRQRYLLLAHSLFSRRGELGRILYHELCHFLWPRLGRGRRAYEAAIAGEMAAAVAGEFGYSSSLAKAALSAGLSKQELARADCSLAGRLVRTRPRRWRRYLCESFCDTGAYLLLRRAGHRRTRHSEWTLERRAWEERLCAWSGATGW